jgi:hypothetical protein
VHFRPLVVGLVILASCPQATTVEPAAGVEAGHSIDAHAPRPAASPIPRTVELDAHRAEESVTSALGHRMVVLGQAPVPVTQLPFRDVVAFAVDGYTYCVAYTPAPNRAECEPDSSIDGHHKAAGEHLGFAVVSFTGIDSAEVEQIRFVEGARFGDFYGDPQAEPVGVRHDRLPGYGSSNRKHSIDSLEVADVDDDGLQEVIAVVEVEEFETVDYYYYECEDDSECTGLADPSAFTAVAYEGHRLLIFRDNLTLQLDATLDQTGYTVFDGWNPASDDFLNHSHSFERDTVVAQWCEVAFPIRDDFTDCIFERACGEPTIRARWEYDGQADAYTRAKEERLREPITDWNEDWAVHCSAEQRER